MGKTSLQSPLFPLSDVVYMPVWTKVYKDIISDRWSKYSVRSQHLEICKDPKRQAKLISHTLKKDAFYRKATHNSYAWIYEHEDGRVEEWYTDDGEHGAWICILREMRKAKLVNGICFVTRYYGWIKLDGDRFRHVIDATKYIINIL
jgi:putative IMPACT (imprinted ancient) family translation regulator